MQRGSIALEWGQNHSQQEISSMRAGTFAVSHNWVPSPQSPEQCLAHGRLSVFIEWVNECIVNLCLSQRVNKWRIPGTLGMLL